jgi:hypothetical protein
MDITGLIRNEIKRIKAVKAKLSELQVLEEIPSCNEKAVYHLRESAEDLLNAVEDLEAATGWWHY